MLEKALKVTETDGKYVELGGAFFVDLNVNQVVTFVNGTLRKQINQVDRWLVCDCYSSKESHDSDVVACCRLLVFVACLLLSLACCCYECCSLKIMSACFMQLYP